MNAVALALTGLAVLLTILAALQLGLDIPFDMFAAVVWLAALAAWGVKV